MIHTSYLEGGFYQPCGIAVESKLLLGAGGYTYVLLAGCRTALFYYLHNYFFIKHF